MATSRANDLANLMSSTTVGSNDLVIDSDFTVAGNVDIAGNVGIGTTSPGSKLEVSGDVSATQVTGARIGFSPQNGGFTFDSATVADYGLTYTSPSTEGTFNTVVSGFSNVKFAVNRAERMRINQAGNVGIGTSSPQAQLDVKNGTTYSSSGDFIARIQQNTNQTGKNGLSVMNAYATSASKIFEVAMGWDGSSAGYYPCFTIDGSGQAIFSNGQPQTERMRIDNTGKVGIGTDAPATELHVNGTISDAIGDVRRPDVNTTSSTTVTPSGSALLYLSNAATTTVNLNNSNLAAGDIHTVYNNTGSAVTITFTGFTVVREDGSVTNIVTDTVTLADGSLLTATAMTSLLLILSSANLTVT